MISALDSRYAHNTRNTERLFNQDRYYVKRTILELRWLLFMHDNNLVVMKDRGLAQKILNEIIDASSTQASEYADLIRTIEKETHHDVKAIEVWLASVLPDDGHLVHLGLTSEDINNTFYALTLLKAKNNYHDWVSSLSAKFGGNRFNNDTLFCTRTHGQLATPSTFRYQFGVFQYRLQEALTFLDGIELSVKWGGTVGTHSVLNFLMSDETNVARLSHKFVTEELSPQLVYESVTTQVSNRDNLCLMLNSVKCINNILIDLCTDIWLYLSNGLLTQLQRGVGSSVMPHKINPIAFEQATGALQMANGLINTIADSISISRMQRDMTDSVKMRQIGVIFGNCELAVEAITRGLEDLYVAPNQCRLELSINYQVYTELLQSALRLGPRPKDAYNKLKDKSQGLKMSKSEFTSLVCEFKQDLLPAHLDKLLAL